MKKVFIILLFLSSQAYSSESENFCNYIQVVKKNYQHISTLNKLGLMLVPQKYITVDFEKETSHFFGKKVKNAHLFIGLLEKKSLKPIQKVKIKAYKQSFNRITKSRFYKEVYGQKDVDSCIDTLLIRPNKSKELLKHFAIILKYQSTYNNHQNIKIQRYAIKHLKSLKKRGWKVHKTLELEKLVEVLTNSKIEHLVIVSHAYSNGVIRDFNSNKLPVSLLQNMSPSLKTISIFSCYPESVQQLFDIDKLKQKRNFFYLKPQLSKNKIMSSTPLFGIRVLKKSLSSLPFSKIEANTKKDCSIKLFGKLENNSRLLVYLNNKLLGNLKNKMNFYCDILREKNTVTVNNLDKTKRSDSRLDKVQISNGLIVKEAKFQNFYRENIFLSSKATLNE